MTRFDTFAIVILVAFGASTFASRSYSQTIEPVSDETCAKIAAEKSVGDQDAKLACSSLNTALKAIKLTKGRYSERVNYVTDANLSSELVADISSSIRHYAPRRKTVELRIPPNAGVKLDDLTSITPGKPVNAILPFLQRIEEKGGKVCHQENSNSGLIVAILAKWVIPTVIPKLVEFVAEKAANARLFGPAKDVDAKIMYNPNGPNTPNGGAVTSVLFVPKSAALQCAPQTL